MGYVAPEVLKKENYTFSCDMWSLGCIAYGLLCGALPFDGETHDETMHKTLKERLEFDLPIWGMISPEAIDFVKQLLVKD